MRETTIKDTSQKKDVAPRNTNKQHRVPGHSSPQDMNDESFQNYLLNGVSRTFALTIPQLPVSLRNVVSNAYLLCRSVDTIEDEPNLTPAQKKQFSEWFVKVIGNQAPVEPFSTALAPLLSENTLEPEHELIAQLPRVVSITRKFDREQQACLERCVRIMAEGMVYFQENKNGNGLQDLKEMDHYCYCVAGIVGEMLTELFCIYSPEIARQKDEMMRLSKSFGQGLQMTNILKDIWDDLKRSACWLPRDVFSREGFDLDQLETAMDKRNFEKGLVYLIGVAHAHLNNALKYTLMIPAKESGLREFCLWALGMALLTLKKIHKNPDFTSGDQVKISRKSVKATVSVTHLAVKQDILLKLLYNLVGTNVPYVPISLSKDP